MRLQCQPGLPAKSVSTATCPCPCVELVRVNGRHGRRKRLDLAAICPLYDELHRSHAAGSGGELPLLSQFPCVKRRTTRQRVSTQYDSSWFVMKGPVSWQRGPSGVALP